MCVWYDVMSVRLLIPFFPVSGPILACQLYSVGSREQSLSVLLLSHGKLLLNAVSKSILEPLTHVQSTIAIC